MEIYPAIDLKDGQCVRLVQGRMEDASLFNPNPADQAQQFASQGARWLHIVDLNGAFEGHSVNKQAILDIIAHSGLKLQLGGGIRRLDQAEYWLNHGVDRLILGTAIVKDPEFAFECCKAFPGQIMLGLDTHDGKVAISGWAERTECDAISLAKQFNDSGAAAIIHTDIAKDGAMAGVNLQSMVDLASAQSLPVIASGGVSQLEDVIALKNTEQLAGVIIGRALYEGTISLEEALRHAS